MTEDRSKELLPAKSPKSTPSAPAGDMDSARQRTIDILCQRFAEDVISVEEFERRVDLANQALLPDHLMVLLSDLPSPSGAQPTIGGGTTAVAPRARHSALVHAHAREHSFIVGVLGGGKRLGRWAPARSNLAVGVLGGVKLDFREAALPPGVTTVNAFALCGGVEIVVPPGVMVESGGIGILGGFEDRSEGEVVAGPETPVLRVSGAAIMGGIEVKTLLPGETHRQGRRRKRDQRKLGRGSRS